MKKMTKRWYEKNDDLKVFMTLLADLPIEVQCEIAVDIIIEASEKIDRDYDKIIKNLAFYNPKNFNRWYDKNPSLHLAVEILRDLDDRSLEELICKFSDKIAESHFIKINTAEVANEAC